jgi:predicted RNA-binding Zn-ribbon protein involved in translation (DUF1610 family)
MATFIIILFICGIAYAVYQSTEGNSTPMSNLIDCPSCGTEVSRFSEKCLSCGHPIRPKREDGCLTLIGFLFVIGGFFFWPLWILSCLIFILAAVSKS